LAAVAVLAAICGVGGGVLLAIRNDEAKTDPSAPSDPTASSDVAPSSPTSVSSQDDNQVENVAWTAPGSAPTTITQGELAVETDPSVPAEPASLDAIPESMATIRNGQIFLEGAVPSEEDAERIVAMAAEILGPDNVIDNYVVDERASDPSNGNITVEDTINFATDSAVLESEGDVLLNQGLALLNLRPAITVTIVGHTDSRGTDASNLALSLGRAEAVKAWFVERGVDPLRLTVRGAGEAEPLASDHTPEGRRQNRRIQFFLENVLG
jgi:OmpA-OmpF porin, OOP family